MTQGASGSPGNAPEAPQATKRSRRPAIIIVGGIVVFLAIVLFAVRNNAQADELMASATASTSRTDRRLQTVEKHACAESHIAEVIFVGEYTGGDLPDLAEP